MGYWIHNYLAADVGATRTFLLAFDDTPSGLPVDRPHCPRSWRNHSAHPRAAAATAARCSFAAASMASGLTSLNAPADLYGRAVERSVRH